MNREHDNRPRTMLAQALVWQMETADIEELNALDLRIPDYLGGEPWADDDVRLVWTSPAARKLLRRHRASLAREGEGRWEAMGIPSIFERLAAAPLPMDEGNPEAAGNGESLVLGEAGIIIEIRRAPASGDWLIRASLSPDALAAIPPALIVRLEDSGGQHWLSGRPDTQGGVSTIWDSEGPSPIERLQEHSLLIKLA